MCGRFTQKISSPELARLFEAEDDADLPGDRYNVAPTDPVAAVVARDGKRVLTELRWGLVPWWSESVKSGSRMINARAETIERSNAFREAFERSRCLIPADGFYEWRQLPDGRRQPFYITSSDGRPLAFAGLHASWRGGPGVGSGRTPVRTCTIVTTAPNDLVGRLHNRMPVILAPEVWDLWLDPEAGGSVSDRERLRDLLVPAPDAGLVMYPVAPLVNDVRKQGPALVEPAAEEPVEPLPL